LFLVVVEFDAGGDEVIEEGIEDVVCGGVWGRLEREGWFFGEITYCGTGG
jgi:hypothetical protein